jgi:hypothetical protein
MNENKIAAAILTAASYARHAQQLNDAQIVSLYRQYLEQVDASQSAPASDKGAILVSSGTDPDVIHTLTVAGYKMETFDGDLQGLAEWAGARPFVANVKAVVQDVDTTVERVLQADAAQRIKDLNAA